MPTIINARKLLDRKSVTMVAPSPVVNAGAMFVTDSNGADQTMLYMTSNTNQLMYDPHEDAFVTLPTITFTGTLQTGSCGRWHPFGPTGTPSSVAAGSAGQSVITTALTLLADLSPRNGNPYRIRITAGSSIGREFDIVSNTGGVNSRITVLNQGATIDATSAFVMLTGRFHILNGGTLATTNFRFYDTALGTWSAGSSITGLPASLSNDCRLALASSAVSQADRGQLTGATATVLTNTSKALAVNVLAGLPIRIVSGTGLNQVRRILSNTATTITVSAAFTVVPDATSTYIVEGFDAGLASGVNSLTTISETAKTWTVNAWSNSQVRIVAGTGVGQVRIIASNTANVITVSVAFTTAPDATSVYVLEGNDDALYLTGNNAVTMFRYSIAANTWVTVAPVTARAGTVGFGHSLNWVSGVTSIDWTDPSAIRNGRFLYSFRGSTSNIVDAYDIALNTWVNSISYGRSGELFASNTGYAYDGTNRIYALRDTGRMYALNLATQSLEPALTNMYPQGTVTPGEKMGLARYNDGGASLTIIYMLRHSGSEFFRCIMI